MKKILKTFAVLVAGLASCALLCQQAGAAQITGTVDMSGNVTLDTKDLATAGSATAFTMVNVSSGSSDFLGTAGAPVTWKTFGFSPSTAPVTTLWTFTSGGNTFSFDLDTITSVARVDSSYLEVDGTGLLHETLKTDTAANWTFVVTDSSKGKSGFTFGFADSNTAVVPDGGMTLSLLGLALVGVEGLRRKLGK